MAMPTDREAMYKLCNWKQMGISNASMIKNK